VSKLIATQSSVVFETVYSTIEKTQFPGFMFMPRVQQHLALSAVRWRSDLHGAANTQQLRRQNFYGRGTSPVELSFSPAAQSRHHLRTAQTSGNDVQSRIYI